ncbi:hypothetical protein ABIB73_000185 [Bradyrhizobium sp. F1.4.3]|uniref:hypothetical protein n=1 Tax=Bradyrhizobium sp. F1.4.3 TaxID=3156356 RepID=UPI003392C39D
MSQHVYLVQEFLGVVIKPMELHLVADTNLFFEFKPIEQLPWGELGADLVVIVLTKPVVDEIDKHKKSNGRTRDRALDIFNRIRAMLTSDAIEVDIQESGPRVVLRRQTSVGPDPKLADRLDYGKPDEKLVGIVSTLAGQAVGYGVKLFTDDAGAAGTAADFGVPFQLIDPAWRRPPAESTEAKQLKEAKKDLAMYRSLEPRIAIRCETADADGVVKVVDKVATPLAEPEVDALIEALRAKHPLRVDFSAPPTSTSTDVYGETKTIEYSSPLDDDVANYRDVRYPAWIETCRQSLRSLHVGRDEAAPLVLLRWAMSNDGSRPAKDVRVEFETGGHLALQRSDRSDDETDAAPSKNATLGSRTLGLPSPPQPPAFVEKVTRTPPAAKQNARAGIPLSSLRGMPSSVTADHRRIMEAASGFSSARRLMERAQGAAAEYRRFQDTVKGLPGFDATLRSTLVDPIVTPHLESIRSLSAHNFRHLDPQKPEEFLYDSWPTKRKVLKGALTCQLWRHQTEEEIFEFTVSFVKEGAARGVVECTVHAENLTEPAQRKIIVERTIETVSLFDLANAMVEACG